MLPENSLSLLGQVIFEPTLFPYKYSSIFKPSHSSYLSAYEDGTDIVFRNVGIQNSHAGELPRRKHTLKEVYPKGFGTQHDSCCVRILNSAWL